MFLKLIPLFFLKFYNIKCCYFCHKSNDNSKINNITTINNNNDNNNENERNNKNKEKGNNEKEKKKDDKNDNYICQNEDKFIEKFNKMKNNLVENYFKNEDLKTKIKSNNLSKTNINDYFKMYHKMIDDNEIFNHKIALELQIYRYILNLEGFTNILDNIIIDEKFQFWVIDKYDKTGNIFSKIQFNEENVNENNINFKFKFIKENSNIKDNIYRSGDCYIDEEKFKYLRCDGCNDKNCLSCKLRNLLIKEGLFNENKSDNNGIFVKIYKSQSDNSHSEFSKNIKNIIYNGLKDELKNTDFFTKYENSELKENINGDIRKCIFIEWALTIEFLKRFNKNILKNDNFILYRTLTKYKIEKVDLFESTSLCCPIFLPSDINKRKNTKNLFFFKTDNINYFRCIFNYIISPIKDSMFISANNLDYELEVGYIPLKRNYKWLNDEKNITELKDMFNRVIFL